MYTQSYEFSNVVTFSVSPRCIVPRMSSEMCYVEVSSGLRKSLQQICCDDQALYAAVIVWKQKTVRRNSTLMNFTISKRWDTFPNSCHDTENMGCRSNFVLVLIEDRNKMGHTNIIRIWYDLVIWFTSITNEFCIVDCKFRISCTVWSSWFIAFNHPSQ